MQAKRTSWGQGTKGGWKLSQWGRQNRGKMIYCTLHKLVFYGNVPWVLIILWEEC